MLAAAFLQIGAAANAKTPTYVLVSDADAQEMRVQSAMVRAASGKLIHIRVAHVDAVASALRAIAGQPRGIIAVPYTICDDDSLTPRLAAATRFVISHGFKVFAASGNRGSFCAPSKTRATVPAALFGVCAVGAIVHGKIPDWSGTSGFRDGKMVPDAWDDASFGAGRHAIFGTSVAVTHAAIRGRPKLLRSNLSDLQRASCNGGGIK